MGKGKEKKEMERIDLLENIRNLPEGMQEELRAFAGKLFKKANIKIRLQETADNSGSKNDVFPKRVIVDLDVKCAEDEFEEYQDCLRYLDEAGAGILNYWPRYRFHFWIKNSRVFFDVLQQGDVFIDTNGQFQVDLPENIKKWLSNIFKDEKGPKPKISFMVEIIDLDKLNIFIKSSKKPVERIYVYDPNEIKISWSGGEFSPRGDEGKIFQELLERRSIIGIDGKPRKSARPLSIQEIEGFVDYSLPEIQIRKTMNKFNKDFLKKEMPFKIPRAKNSCYHMEERENNTYKLYELERSK